MPDDSKIPSAGSAVEPDSGVEAPPTLSEHAPCVFPATLVQSAEEIARLSGSVHIEEIRIAGYEILEKLGHGGMGAVYRAEDKLLRRKVALKVMLPALAADGLARDRFLREARAAAAIRHDHVVTIFQVGQDGNLPYLVMELLEGEPLDRRCKTTRRLLAKMLGY